MAEPPPSQRGLGTLNVSHHTHSQKLTVFHTLLLVQFLFQLAVIGVGGRGPSYEILEVY